MKKTNNRGVSFVEILIAVIIFTICVIPIITQLTTGIRLGQKADDNQAATDYATSVVESFKQMELSSSYSKEQLHELAVNLGMESSVETPGVSYTHSYYTVDKDGNPVTGIISLAGNESIEEMYKKVQAYNEEHETSPVCLIRKYKFTGTSTIDERDYNVEIYMDTQQYAIGQLSDDTGTYVDPNSVNIGNLSSLDKTLTALITDTSNSDSVVTEDVKTSILTTMENSSIKQAQEYADGIHNGNRNINDIFTDMKKKIVLEITDTGVSAGYSYKVSCNLVYDMTVQDPTVFDEQGNITTIPLFTEGQFDKTYSIYSMEFKEFPDIYLMYNQFMFQNEYQDDIIQIKNLTSEKAKVYVIRTAEDDSKVTNLIVDSTETSDANSLLPGGNRDRNLGSGYAYSTSFVIGDDVNAFVSEDNWNLHPVEIYTNILLGPEDAKGRKTVLATASVPPTGDTATTQKLTVNYSTPGNVVQPLYDDERYSEQGRLYDVTVKLTQLDYFGNETDQVVTINTSKGDY